MLANLKSNFDSVREQDKSNNQSITGPVAPLWDIHTSSPY